MTEGMGVLCHCSRPTSQVPLVHRSCLFLPVRRESLPPTKGSACLLGILRIAPSPDPGCRSPSCEIYNLLPPPHTEDTS